MSQSDLSPNGNPSIDPLIEALITILNKLKDPIPLFLLAICIVSLLAAALGGQGLVIELRVFLGFLAVLGVLALVLPQIVAHSTAKRGKKHMSQDKFRVLQELLGILNEKQFNKMIVTLLSPSVQDDLTQPRDKSSFLNDMHRWGRLEEVEDYMRAEFPDQFAGETKHGA
jgi:hypothetical protein